MRLLLLGSICLCFLNACTTKVEEQKTDSVALADTTLTLKEDWECIIGQKVGIITNAISEQELIDKLGSTNVSAHDTIYGAEGIFSIGTIIYKGTPNEAHIVWKDTLNFKNPEYVTVGFSEPGDKSEVKWYTNTGVKVGTTLKELEQINDSPFKFSGFDWDYGGTVVNWEGGKLGEKNQGGYLAVFLDFDYEDDSLQGAADKLLGDSFFDSKDPNAQKLNPYVSHFIIGFR